VGSVVREKSFGFFGSLAAWSGSGVSSSARAEAGRAREATKAAQARESFMGATMSYRVIHARACR
jgi:hypothetical protein